MFKLVLLRHGESEWNAENRFTGWTDVKLTSRGVNEAKDAGKILKKNHYNFDLAFSSVLKRANHTMDLCLKEMELNNIPVVYNWRLNERHYGSLQGLNKKETAKKYGEEQVQTWRRSYDTPPPKLKKNDKSHPQFNKKYSFIDASKLPSSESLKDTIKRVIPFWEKNIKKKILENKNLLIVAHGNSLRALVKILNKISNEEIIKLNIPTGVPLIYELDSNLNPFKYYYLGDPELIKMKLDEVVAQGKS